MGLNAAVSLDIISTDDMQRIALSGDVTVIDNCSQSASSFVSHRVKTLIAGQRARVKLTSSKQNHSNVVSNPSSKRMSTFQCLEIKVKKTKTHKENEGYNKRSRRKTVRHMAILQTKNATHFTL